jgi:hypothetical protein
MLRSSLRLAVSLWLLRKAFRIARWGLPFLIVVAAWPVTIVAVAGSAAAWLRGWPSVRLVRTAACFLPFTAAWLVLEAVRLDSWRPIGSVLIHDWEPSRQWLTGLGATGAFLRMSLVAIPAGLALATLAWWWRNYAMNAGIGGWLASAPITFDERQWKHQARRARGVNKAPGSVPLLSRGSLIPVGGTIRTIGHRWRSVFTVPSTACGRHMVIVGATGRGKTNLMMRLWTGWFTAALRAALAGRGRRPLLIVLDCKGGPDARDKAARTGATVIGLASESNHEWLKSHGVVPVAYGDGVAGRIRAAVSSGVDAFIDTYGDGYVELALALGVAAERIDTIVDFAAAAKHGVKTDRGTAAGPGVKVLAELAGLIADGPLEVPIANVYPLAQVREAYTELERRHTRGKIVLRP